MFQTITPVHKKNNFLLGVLMRNYLSNSRNNYLLITIQLVDEQPPMILEN